ncbi:hypothetical protein PT2222_80043 [Paraburkholderia tropica]
MLPDPAKTLLSPRAREGSGGEINLLAKLTE